MFLGDMSLRRPVLAALAMGKRPQRCAHPPQQSVNARDVKSEYYEVMPDGALRLQ